MSEARTALFRQRPHLDPRATTALACARTISVADRHERSLRAKGTICHRGGCKYPLPQIVDSARKGPRLRHWNLPTSAGSHSARTAHVCAGCDMSGAVVLSSNPTSAAHPRKPGSWPNGPRLCTPRQRARQGWPCLRTQPAQRQNDRKGGKSLIQPLLVTVKITKS